jgi:hypothetical protein
VSILSLFYRYLPIVQQSSNCTFRVLYQNVGCSCCCVATCLVLHLIYYAGLSVYVIISEFAQSQLPYVAADHILFRFDGSDLRRPAILPSD